MMIHTTGTIDGLNLGTVAHPARPGQAVSQDTQDSIVLGWCRGSGHITVCLGTRGILAMYTVQAVITPFLPDQGSGQATRAGQQAELSRGLRVGAEQIEWRLRETNIEH